MRLIDKKKRLTEVEAGRWTCEEDTKTYNGRIDNEYSCVLFHCIFIPCPQWN